MTDGGAQRPRSSAQARPPRRPSPAVIRRRRIVVASLAGALVLVVALVTALWWPGFAVPDPLPTPTATVTAPVPTPTISPAERTGEQTALTKALPDAVLAHTQQGIENLPQWQEEDSATESWTVTYADGTGADATTITLQVGQWAKAEAATSFYEAQVKAAGNPVKQGDVLVDDQVVGAYALVHTDGGAVLWWHNGTVVLSAQGPADAVEDFYSAFPL
ncbi:hypothetical protein [Xylanimonas ulmi]|uniref:Uncharacterized protein n=1 Tax=Xylanimonas ulmi TaxID=228973 RepID=A0A4Q7M8K5_9MICO|nr:hypothetical protein [Xylanibacterium ulmi]RZS63012.1 hypothetical protein EV386_3369 [Xylanibacterium ulmi]